VSFAGRRRTDRTSEDRKAKQTAKDVHPCHAAARPSENIKHHFLMKTLEKNIQTGL
jgi:hypothetical protein